MATPGGISMAFGTPSGDTVLCRRPCRSTFPGQQKHLCNVRTIRWRVCCPKRPHENLAHVAAALPQVSQDHTIHEITNEDADNGAEVSEKHGKNEGNGVLVHQEQRSELNAEGTPCHTPDHM